MEVCDCVSRYRFWQSADLVHDGKGNKESRRHLPETLRDQLQLHLQRVKMLWQADHRELVPGVELPDALSVKYPSAGQQWLGNGFFHSQEFIHRSASWDRARHHTKKRCCNKRCSKLSAWRTFPNELRVIRCGHSFATHLLEAGSRIRPCKNSWDIAMSVRLQIYTHVMNKPGWCAQSAGLIVSTQMVGKDASKFRY